MKQEVIVLTRPAKESHALPGGRIHFGVGTGELLDPHYFDNGLPVPPAGGRYSVNAGLWGLTIGGGTLHTSDAVQTINRIVDVFPSHQQQQVRQQIAAKQADNSDKA